MATFYKVRQKSTGLYGKGRINVRWTKNGQSYSERALHHVNKMVTAAVNGGPGRPSVPQYDLELVKFTTTEEVLDVTDTHPIPLAPMDVPDQQPALTDTPGFYQQDDESPDMSRVQRSAW